MDLSTDQKTVRILGMDTNEWKLLDIRNKRRYGMIMSVYMIPMQVVLFAILIPALIHQRPLSILEAGIASGCILFSYRWVQRIRKLFRLLDEVQAKQLARRTGKTP